MRRAVVACFYPTDNVHVAVVLLQLGVGNGVQTTNGTMVMWPIVCATGSRQGWRVCGGGPQAAPGLTTAAPPKEIHYHTMHTLLKHVTHRAKRLSFGKVLNLTSRTQRNARTHTHKHSHMHTRTHTRHANTQRRHRHTHTYTHNTQHTHITQTQTHTHTHTAVTRSAEVGPPRTPRTTLLLGHLT
jgi:hypothetical protein